MGVDVTFILDRRYQGGRNLREVAVRWPVGRRRPRVYAWQDPDDEIAKLHAKVVLVDGTDVLITSANMTGHGLRHNLELGLRVRGVPAEHAADHLGELIRTGVVEPVVTPG
jgi:phosphatidylserine/phosphatidylglycerophosphate/cardiolipin synthase-like enzyme